MKRAGPPDDFIRATQALYVNDRHELLIDNIKYFGVDGRSGLRQGCPLSPFIFVLRLTHCFPDATSRAFADDVDAVPPDLDSHWK